MSLLWANYVIYLEYSQRMQNTYYMALEIFTWHSKRYYVLTVQNLLHVHNQCMYDGELSQLFDGEIRDDHYKHTVLPYCT